jgi:putative effector of murein hydrolase LrgA (UPF0299 family)
MHTNRTLATVLNTFRMGTFVSILRQWRLVDRWWVRNTSRTLATVMDAFLMGSFISILRQWRLIDRRCWWAVVAHIVHVIAAPDTVSDSD